MKNNKLNLMRFGHKKDRIVIGHLNRPVVKGFAGFIKSLLLEKPVSLVLTDCKDIDLAGLKIIDSDISVIMMQKEIFYGFKSGNCAARTIIFHEIGHLICGGHEKYKDRPEQYNIDRLNSLEEGKILEIEMAADDMAVKYLGAEYVVQGLRDIIEISRPASDADDFEREQYMVATEELAKRIERIQLKYMNR